MSVSRAKNIRRDMCRILGHTYDIKNKNSPMMMDIEFYAKCSRCLKVIGRPVKVKYADLYARKFDILNRAKERIVQSIQAEHDDAVRKELSPDIDSKA